MNPTYDQQIIKDLLAAIHESANECGCKPACLRCRNLTHKTSLAVKKNRFLEGE